jgi:hypothetical protein
VRSLDGGEEKIILVSSTTDKHGHHHLITEDMLTDRLGFEDLMSGSSSPIGNGFYTVPLVNISLTSVNERMSEESLDDCHAFNDINIGKKTSANVDGSSNNSVLGKLAEEDFEDEEEEGEGNAQDSADSTMKDVQTDETQHIMFETLDLISTAEERRKLEEETKKMLESGV